MIIINVQLYNILLVFIHIFVLIFTLSNYWRVRRTNGQKNTKWGLWDLRKVYVYQSYWNVLLLEESWRRISTYRSASITQSTHLLWRIIIKKFLPDLDVMLLVAKTRTFDSPNSLYLEIFWFIRLDFGCVGDKEYSIKQNILFLRFQTFIKKTITTKNLNDCSLKLFLKVPFLRFSVNLTS